MQTPPRYGRFIFPDIQEFTRRLRQVADTYMGQAGFNSFLTTHDMERYYGLGYRELEAVFQENQPEVKSITTACSGEQGRSVNINVRFPGRGRPGEGQYVVVSSSPFENSQISQMLEGVWIAPGEAELRRNEALCELVDLLMTIKLRQTVRETPPLAARTPPASAMSSITVVRDKFRFDDRIAVDVIIDLLEHLSEAYLDGAPFNIRLITTDGEPYSDIGIKGLRRFFEKRRSLVLKVFMDAATVQGELVDMMLSFGPQALRLNAEVEITSVHSKDIQNLIRETLEQASVEIRSGGGSPMVHEMFRFDQEQFSLERVARLIQAISGRYLQGEMPTAFLSTAQGETFPALSLTQLRTVYARHEGQVSFLLFGINQLLTGQTFSLAFQFRAQGHEPYGSLSMMWSNDEIHQSIRAVIWEQLQLRSYRAEQQNHLVALSEPEQGGRFIQVDPVFEGRGYEEKKRTALVVMPLEAYWSDSLWEHLRQLLESLGWDSRLAGSLFVRDTLEPDWGHLNEADLVIADLTYKHQDVFYKTGIAHTLGKRVILITQHARDLPADFLRFPHVVYDNNLYGVKKLSERLVELIKR
ncbi:MAG: hypothetical protein OHK0039_38430 [Bacteroidia bacterium]